jgi:hypothetical protein
MVESRNSYCILFGQTEGKKHLGRWEDNTKVDIIKMEGC